MIYNALAQLCTTVFVGNTVATIHQHCRKCYFSQMLLGVWGDLFKIKSETNQLFLNYPHSLPVSYSEPPGCAESKEPVQQPGTLSLIQVWIPGSIVMTWRKRDISCQILCISPRILLGWGLHASYRYGFSCRDPDDGEWMADLVAIKRGHSETPVPINKPWALSYFLWCIFMQTSPFTLY